MRLRNRRTSRDVIDQRHSGPRVFGRGAGGGGLGILAIVVVGYFLGVDLTPLLNQQGAPVQQQQTGELLAQEEEAGLFASQMLATPNLAPVLIRAGALGIGVPN